MPILFRCPHCNQETVVADEYAGQTGPCSGCGQRISIPQTGKTHSKMGVTPILVVLIGVAVLGGGLFLLGAIAFLAPMRAGPRIAAQTTSSYNKLRMIGLAMHNYHDTYRCLPPAYLADDDGKPMTSWRTVVLPYLDHQPLANQYDSNAAWDDPQNLGVRSTPVPAFQSPFFASPTSTECHYFLITGKGTAFDDSNPKKFAELLDGLSNIAIAIEAYVPQVEWSQPTDIDIDELPKLQQQGAFLNNRILVLMADGSVQELDATTQIPDLQSMARIDDGE